MKSTATFAFIFCFLFSCSKKTAQQPQQVERTPPPAHSVTMTQETTRGDADLAELMKEPLATGQQDEAKKKKAPDDMPRIPDELPKIQVALWRGMTFQKLDYLFSEFSRTDPPSIEYQGICERIVFSMNGAKRSSKVKAITCFLDRRYPIRDALAALGLAIVNERSSAAKNFIVSSTSTEGVAHVRSSVRSAKDSTTDKIFITYR